MHWYDNSKQTGENISKAQRETSKQEKARKKTKYPKPKPAAPSTRVRTAYMCVLITVYNNVVHNTALNSSDNVPSYPPDNHHNSGDVYWRGHYREIAFKAFGCFQERHMQ